MRKMILGILAAWVCVPPAHAWGDLGHEVTALIAYRHLTPPARVALDDLLRQDTDPLTRPDFASRATWADKYRNTHRETAAWHFVDVEIDHPDVTAACFGFPALAPGTLASQGTAQDCIINKLDQFTAELASVATPQPERLIALKFLIHFAGDLHQPLHAADHEDRGGNCIGLDPPLEERAANLHAYWDVSTVRSLGTSAPQIAALLDARITRSNVIAWTLGDPHTWAQESYDLARHVIYGLPALVSLPMLPTCLHTGSISLTAAAQAAARSSTSLQLQRAGIRMAALLNRALAH